MRIVLLATVCLLVIASTSAESNADVLNSKVERTVDLTSQLARVSYLLTIENKAAAPLTAYTFVVEPSNSANVAYVGAQLYDAKKSDDDDKDKLSVTKQPVNAKGAFFKIDLGTKGAIKAGATGTIEVQVVFMNSLKPYPTEIAQSERQLVLYKGSSVYYSLYATKSQISKVNLASDKVEAFTQVKPTSKSDQTITYGPYADVKPFEFNEISVHYENNAPFLRVKNMVRTIEVSNWGNVAVEETIDLEHAGAKLKGSFSRYDYMRKQGAQSSVKAFRMLLPATARDVYYRDEIGNISTSNLKESREQVELELRPRFPLFGGWKTHYTVGYNLPTYQALYVNGNQYKLKMKFVDHVFDDQFIEHLTVKIILPEFSKDIDFVAPFEVQRGQNERHYTYLDTVGRPVIVAHKDNLVEDHTQDFEVRYTFQKMMILQEPLLLVAAFYFLFTLVIIIVRIDFSIDHQKSE